MKLISFVLLLSSFTFAQRYKGPFEDLGLFFDGIFNPAQVDEINTERLSFILAQRTFGKKGEVEILYNSSEHQTVNNELTNIKNRYPFLKRHMAHGPLGYEPSSLDDIWVQGTTAMRSMDLYHYVSGSPGDRSQTNRTKYYEQVMKLINMLPKDDDLIVKDEKYSYLSGSYQSFTKNISYEYSLSYSDNSILQTLDGLDFNKLEINLAFDIDETQELTDKNLNSVGITLSNYHGKYDMQFRKAQLLKLFPTVDLFKDLSPTKDRRIEGMIASGFQTDDVVAYHGPNDELKWIFYTAAMEGKNFVAFNLQLSSQNLIVASEFEEACFEHMNGDSQTIEDALIKDGGFEPSRLTVLNDDWETDTYCHKIRYKGIYDFYSLGAGGIL